MMFAKRKKHTRKGDLESAIEEIQYLNTQVDKMIRTSKLAITVQVDKMIRTQNLSIAVQVDKIILTYRLMQKKAVKSQQPNICPPISTALLFEQQLQLQQIQQNNLQQPSNKGPQFQAKIEIDDLPQ
ncbi:MAG: hypothetical protein EZS28_013285 [Streblomastix strix]|uniref:Uncharacterized protein n=1 Tax=Streblomastix strix TaxID=222440 RepID=A0A5J4W8K5_9EUKA|nr:MAG: hypothetical protein EZS28_013285 [Streblomastix strix]